MDMNIFEYAAEKKLRFPYRGMVAVEDLYDLTTTELDYIYKTLKREEKESEEESLLSNKSSEDISLTVKIEIIKHIVEKKLAQIEARKKAAENKEKKNKILEALSRKQDETLQSKSIEELQQMLEDL